MTKEYTKEEVIDACIDEVNGWDLDTLLNYAYDNLTDYFLDSADAEDLELFMEGEDVNV
jgi:hypothetical protein|tara:strand:+ start:950 stop:1126 length:177 start_codon:yes stop_codon:yes gene_type:complete